MSSRCVTVTEVCKATANAGRLTRFLVDVLMIPKRVVPRFGDLTSEEVSDLFASTQQVTRVLEKEYKAQ